MKQKQENCINCLFNVIIVPQLLIEDPFSQEDLLQIGH